MDRLRRARTAQRGRVTKTLNEINAELAKEELNRQVVRVKFERLNEVIQELAEADQRVQDAMLDAEVPEEEMDAEMAAADDYKDQVRAMKHRVNDILDQHVDQEAEGHQPEAVTSSKQYRS